MKRKEFYKAIQREADTDTQQINAADVSRVLAVAFRKLREMSLADALATIAGCVASGDERDCTA